MGVGKKQISSILPYIQTLLESQTSLLSAKCAPTDLIGDCVYATDIKDNGLYVVNKVDPNDEEKMPAIGIIINKENSTSCQIQLTGIVENIYNGMEIRKVLYVNVGGGLTQSIPPESIGDRMFIQSMGMALDKNVFVLSPSSFYIRRRG